MTRVGICESQPITAQGLRAVLAEAGDMELTHFAASLADAAKLLRDGCPEIFVLDKSFGAHAVLNWLSRWREAGRPCAVVVWGHSISEPEALRLLQRGVRGIVRKSAPVAKVLACLRAVARGTSWMEDELLRDVVSTPRHSRSELTPRERQVLELVEQGLKNKEIARELGIRPGTVKIHLKHIFEKTGVRGRYGLALTGMQEKGLLTLPQRTPEQREGAYGRGEEVRFR